MVFWLHWSRAVTFLNFTDDEVAGFWLELRMDSYLHGHLLTLLYYMILPLNLLESPASLFDRLSIEEGSGRRCCRFCRLLLQCLTVLGWEALLQVLHLLVGQWLPVLILIIECICLIQLVVELAKTSLTDRVEVLTWKFEELDLLLERIVW